MGDRQAAKTLKKELGLLDVFAIAAGTTLSAGFFLLPGLAATQVGPAIVLVYLLAAIPLIPAMFSIIELATAMPRAGGVYYFLDRTLGPYFGTIGGLGTWLALVLKVSFALVGMGAYLALFLDAAPVVPIAIVLAIVLGIVNYFGAKNSGRLQLFLVGGLFVILAVFMSVGVPSIEPRYFTGFFDAGASPILATTGLVCISYVGVTNVASLSEEVKNPERNLPRGVIIALSVAIAIYGVGSAVMVGVLGPDRLAGDLTPVASAAESFLGRPGELLTTVAALLAFVSVANAGIMSASRYPLAMSRDHLVPAFFRRVGHQGTPLYALLLTVGTIVLILLTLDPTGIAKLASAFQLLMFALACAAVVVMRESQIESYDPGYHSPLYPWMQLIGITVPLYLITVMGIMPLLFTVGLVVVGTIWYQRYGREKVSRDGAIFHVFERLGRRRYQGLDGELRGILKEKGLRNHDPFDEVIARSLALDLEESTGFEEILEPVADHLAAITQQCRDEFVRKFMEGTRVGATPVTHGIALPHMRSERLQHAEMVLVRATKGVRICVVDPITDREEEQCVHALFFLASPEADPAQHLRILARIAGRVEEESFEREWQAAATIQEIKEALLHDERFVSLLVDSASRTGAMIGCYLRDVELPSGCLVAVIQRGGEAIVPRGSTVISKGDRLTVLGDPMNLRELTRMYQLG